MAGKGTVHNQHTKSIFIGKIARTVKITFNTITTAFEKLN